MLNLQDLVVNLDDLTLLENSQVFDLEDIGSIPFEVYGKNIVASISITSDSDL